MVFNNFKCFYFIFIFNTNKMLKSSYSCFIKFFCCIKYPTQFQFLSVAIEFSLLKLELGMNRNRMKTCHYCSLNSKRKKNLLFL